ncbi:MAG: GGDEF domain-containing protein [bacterium]
MPSGPDLEANTLLLKNPFLLPSGQRRASLIVLRGSDVGRELPLVAEEVELGRDVRLPIPIEDEMVSRRHAVIRRVGGADEFRHVIRDLESTNGILVNNRKLSEVELRDGDRIVLGETVLLYRVLDEIDIGYQEEIKKLVRYHELTGFLTLKEFYRMVRREMSAGSDARPFALLMVDVDNLREINALYGHLAGGAVIRRIGEVFRGVLTADQAVGIYGGDEFICLLPSTRRADAFDVAERLRLAVERDTLKLNDSRIPFTICIGIAEYPADGDRIQDLVQRADVALYRAKAQGKNRTVVYESASDSRVR